MALPDNRAAAAASCASTTSSRRNHLWREQIERADLRRRPFRSWQLICGLEHGTSL